MRTCLQAQAANGTNPAVLLYMVDALQYFKDKRTAQIKETAFEIALRGTQGIEPAKQGYKLAHTPGKTFSGHHLLAFYCISWKPAIPEMIKRRWVSRAFGGDPAVKAESAGTLSGTPMAG